MTKVVILDCCFSGRAFGDELGGDDAALLGQLAVDGCSLLTSAQADHVALVLPGSLHTAFTGELLSILGQGLPIDEEFVTFDHVYRSLRDRLQRLHLPTPLARTLRNSGDVVLSRNRAFARVAAESLGRRHDRAAEAAAQGQWLAVRPELAALAAEQARVLGADHLDTQRTRVLLAHAVGATGDPREASHLLRELIHLCRSVEPAPPTLAWAETDLAVLSPADAERRADV